jgi:hypothetical protein
VLKGHELVRKGCCPRTAHFRRLLIVLVDTRRTCLQCVGILTLQSFLSSSLLNLPWFPAPCPQATVLGTSYSVTGTSQFAFVGNPVDIGAP